MSEENLTGLLLRLPLDLTGTSTDNKVEGEVHELVDMPNRAFVTDYGPFYTKDLKVYDHLTGQLLTPAIQYKAVQLIKAATTRAGQEVCAVVVVTDASVSPQVRVDYQAVGGPYTLSVNALKEMIELINIDNRPITWGEIIGKLDLFPPGHHLHDLGDIYGFEYLVLAIEEVRKAILMGDAASHDEIYRAMVAMEAELNATLSDINDNMQRHIDNHQNPHQTDKEQVGLGSVENYPMATEAQMLVGTSKVLYTSPYLVAKLITAMMQSLVDSFNAHVENTNNPHGTTKGQVGLGNVPNYAEATDAEAIAGTVTNKLLTPRALNLHRSAFMTVSGSEPPGSAAGYREGHIWYKLE